MDERTKSALVDRACAALWEAETAVRELANAGVVLESQIAANMADLAEILDHVHAEVMRTVP